MYSNDVAITYLHQVLPKSKIRRERLQGIAEGASSATRLASFVEHRISALMRLS